MPPRPGPGLAACAGRTAYDTALTALQTIRAEWLSTDDFNTRVRTLSSNSFPDPLNASTVLPPNAGDTVTSGPGRNWTPGQ